MTIRNAFNLQFVRYIKEVVKLKEVKMVKKSIFVDVEPSVIKWALESTGLSSKEVSKKLSEKDDLIEKWLTKKSKPTFRLLERLSKIVKRPVASFLLSSSPKEKPLPKDYRMLPNREGKFENKTLLAIRRARSLQEITRELSLYIHDDTKAKLENITIKEDPKKVAEKYRNLIKLDERNQTKFGTPYELYNHLRNSLEKFNIITFQISMPLEDARGFVLLDNDPVVIVVNSKDIVEARTFTLIHELGHILLGEAGIDLPEFESSNNIEKWCNTFSANFLLPDEVAKRVFRENGDKLIDPKRIDSLSRRYKVSKAMLLYRMSDLGFITKEMFMEILERYKTYAQEPVKCSIPQEKLRFSEMGNKFISLVADNLDKNNITYSDALNYLSIKSKKLDKLLGQAKT